MSTAITDFNQLANSVTVRTEIVTVEMENGPVDITVRELSGAITMELMRRSPNTIRDGGVTITDNSTSQLDMAFVVAYCAVSADDHEKPLQKSHQKWNALPSRVIRPLFDKALEISGLNDEDDDEDVGN